MNRYVAGAAALAVLGGAGVAAAASPHRCRTEGEDVTLSGRIELTPATNAATGVTYEYPRLRLDGPLCYQSRAHGDLPSVETIAIVPGSPRDLRGLADRDGAQLTLRGRLARRRGPDEPPEALLLLQPGARSGGQPRP